MRAGRNSRWPLVAVAASIALVLGLGVLAILTTGQSASARKATRRSDRIAEQHMLAGLAGRQLVFAAARLSGFALEHHWRLTSNDDTDRATLKRYVTQSSLFALGATLVDSKGRRLTAVLPDGRKAPPVTDKHYAPMLAGVAAGEPGISNAVKVGGSPAVAIAVPIGGFRSPRALLVGYVDLRLWPLEGNVRQFVLGPQVAAMALDRKGVVVAATDPALVGTTSTHRPAVRAALAAKSGMHSYAAANGKKLITSSGAVGVGGWTVVTVQPAKMFYGSTSRDRLDVLVALAAVLTAAVVVIVVISYLRQRTVRQLAADAVVDPLTGLGTRRLLAIRLAYAVPRSRRAGTNLAVLFVDLDGFKRVNDDHGHAAGDEVLQVVGARLRRSVRDEDLVARLGGDEFVILVEDLHDLSELQILGRRLISDVARPIELGRKDVSVRASVGIAVLPADSTLPDRVSDAGVEILNAADRAMYVAKTAGGGVQAVILGKTPQQSEQPMPNGHRTARHTQVSRV
jgi:diguanylate cyclase (GGDEF)-like protein